jgi:hypothetical protein
MRSKVPSSVSYRFWSNNSGEKDPKGKNAPGGHFPSSRTEVRMLQRADGNARQERSHEDGRVVELADEGDGEGDALS